MALQPDNKIVVGGAPNQPQAGDTLQDFVLLRLRPTGKIDNSFGQNGYIYTSFGEKVAYITSILPAARW